MNENASACHSACKNTAGVIFYIIKFYPSLCHMPHENI